MTDFTRYTDAELHNTRKAKRHEIDACQSGWRQASRDLIEVEQEMSRRAAEAEEMSRRAAEAESKAGRYSTWSDAQLENSIRLLTNDISRHNRDIKTSEEMRTAAEAQIELIAAELKFRDQEKIVYVRMDAANGIKPIPGSWWWNDGVMGAGYTAKGVTDPSAAVKYIRAVFPDAKITITPIKPSDRPWSG